MEEPFSRFADREWSVTILPKAFLTQKLEVLYADSKRWEFLCSLSLDQ